MAIFEEVIEDIQMLKGHLREAQNDVRSMKRHLRVAECKFMKEIVEKGYHDCLTINYGKLDRMLGGKR